MWVGGVNGMYKKCVCMRHCLPNISAYIPE